LIDLGGFEMFTVVTNDDDDGTPVKERTNVKFGGGMKVDPQQMASFAKIQELLISGALPVFLIIL
jgi:hypothetical protein